MQPDAHPVSPSAALIQVQCRQVRFVKMQHHNMQQVNEMSYDATLLEDEDACVLLTD